MKTPVDNYEAAMYTALESMRAERWLDGFNSLEKVERLCRQYGFLEALPPRFNKPSHRAEKFGPRTSAPAEMDRAFGALRTRRRIE